MNIKTFDFSPEASRPLNMESTHAGIIPDRAQTDNEGADDAAVRRVGIFCDEMPQNIITRVVNYQLDVVQLNGQETPTVIRNLRRTIDPDIHAGILFMKRITIAAAADFDACQPYEDCVDYFLFDLQDDGISVADHYKGTKPFLLSTTRKVS